MLVARYQVISITLTLSLLVGGCSTSSTSSAPRRIGAKINIADFKNRTASYKGKSIYLQLKVAEAINASQGRSLRDYLGRDVKFTTVSPRGERLDLVIKLPEDIPIPEIGTSDEVGVRFVCTRGDLRQGNEAKLIEEP